MTAGPGRYVLVGIELLPNAKTLGRTRRRHRKYARAR